MPFDLTLHIVRVRNSITVAHVVLITAAGDQLVVRINQPLLSFAPNACHPLGHHVVMSTKRVAHHAFWPPLALFQRLLLIKRHAAVLYKLLHVVFESIRPNL